MESDAGLYEIFLHELDQSIDIIYIVAISNIRVRNKCYALLEMLPVPDKGLLCIFKVINSYSIRSDSEIALILQFYWIEFPVSNPQVLTYNLRLMGVTAVIAVMILC